MQNDSPYLSFPFGIDVDGPRTSSRAGHVREQIEQVLFTGPRERVFRPEFGVGIRRLVFEPNNSTLWNLTRKQLTVTLAEALYGEVDPKTLEIGLVQNDGALIITISYTLAAINTAESYAFTVGGGNHG